MIIYSVLVESTQNSRRDSPLSETKSKNTAKKNSINSRNAPSNPTDPSLRPQKRPQDSIASQIPANVYQTEDSDVTDPNLFSDDNHEYSQQLIEMRHDPPKIEANSINWNSQTCTQEKDQMSLATPNRLLESSQKVQEDLYGIFGTSDAGKPDCENESENLHSCCKLPKLVNEKLVECNACRELSHGSCVGLFSETEEDTDPGVFKCPKCRGGQNNVQLFRIRRVLHLLMFEGAASIKAMADKLEMKLGEARDIRKTLIDDGLLVGNTSGGRSYMKIIWNSQSRARFNLYFCDKVLKDSAKHKRCEDDNDMSLPTPRVSLSFKNRQSNA